VAFSNDPSFSSFASSAPTKAVDAFILFNEAEDAVSKIVNQLQSFGITTHFFRRDISFGAPIDETPQLTAARTVVVFLGRRGWGASQLKIAEQAQSLKKPIIPVILERPPERELDRAGGLFRNRHYLNLAGEGTVKDLADAIQRREVRESRGFETLASGEFANVRDLVVNLLRRLSPPITQSTDLATAMLAGAALINTPPQGAAEISTTRLLIAAADAGAAITEAIRDSYVVIALTRVIATDRAFSGFQNVRSQYVKPEVPRRTISGISATENIQKILAAAAPDGALTADTLVAALLSQPDTKIEQRLNGAGIQPSRLRAAVLAQLHSMNPLLDSQWQSLFADKTLPPDDQPSDVTPPPEPVPPTVVTITYAQMGNDNPDSANLDDKLGVADEAHAFARVAAAKHVDPPLAFGVFGDWGSGKSFFMRLMQDYVEKLARRDVDEAKTGLFHDKIVQIRFNAWHYAETNLWASLVDHIFSEFDRWILKEFNQTEQDKLFDKLTTARDLTLESAERLVQRRQEQKAASERVAVAQRALAAAKEKIGVTPKVFWEAVSEKLKEDGKTKEVQKVAETLGLDQLASNTELLKTTIDSLTVEGQRTRMITQGIWRNLLRAPALSATLAVIFIIPVGSKWLLNYLQSIGLLQPYLQDINATVVAIAGLFWWLAMLLGMISRHVTHAANTLEGFRDYIDTIIAKQIEKPNKDVAEAQQKLAKLNADVSEAHALLATSSDHLAEAAREYASGTGRGRLLRFVRERVNQGEYAKHLGLIAMVRKDFTDLSAMMTDVDPSVQREAARRAEAYKTRIDALIKSAGEMLTDDEKKQLDQDMDPAPAIVKPIFQRIVLYIDDLDRCSPDKVVDVLQAVHLFLTFPLFVVVVAVDARWVSRSLEDQYSHLLESPQANGSASGATPGDYLEKIFQVPYWVRPMTPDGSRRLLKARTDAAPFGGRSVDPPPDPNPEPSPTANEVTPSAEQRPAGAADANPPPNVPAAANSAMPQFPPQPSPADDASAKPASAVTAKALTLTEAEHAFMNLLAPQIGTTPRRALRFLNVYRVIKASLSAADLHKLENSAGYRALMTQVAITTGAPTLQRQWVDVLNETSRSDDLSKLMARLQAGSWYQASPEANRLAAIVAAFWASPEPGEAAQEIARVQSTGIDSLRNYVGIAMRYSFAV
jgi:hypothetical protein